MAISKTQPMRSAEIDLVDGFNQLESDVADEILARQNADAALGDRIDDEILARQSADTALGSRIDDEITNRTNADMALGGRIDNEILARQDADTSLGGRISDEAGARANADTEIMNVIGSGFSALNTIASNISNLLGFDNRFRVGMTQNYTIAANDSQAITVTFNTPYEQTDEIIVLVCPVGASESYENIGVKVFTAAYDGFTGSIRNDTSDSHTLALGFVAIKVN